MSEPSTLIPVSWSASGFEDGLGRRTLEIDRESGAMLERLHLRPELGAFEAFLRERVAFTTAFDDQRFARVKGIERDHRGGLTIISQFVAGNRLNDLLEAATGLPAHEATCPSVDAALGFLLDVLPALGSLHEYGGHAHGTLAPGRIVLTPTSQVVILDWLFGPVMQRLQFNRRRLWVEFGVAATAGPTALDIASDVSQASLAAMMIVLGRPLRENEYPDAISTLVSEVIEIAQIRGSSQFASGLETFLQRTLPLPGRTPHANAADAVAEVRHIAREIGVSRCRTALTAFVDDMNRVLAAERQQEGEALDIDPAEADVAHLVPDLTVTPALPPGTDPEASDPLASVPEITALVDIPKFDEFDASVGSDAYEDPPVVAEQHQPHRKLLEEIFGPFAGVSGSRFEEPPALESSSERDQSGHAELLPIPETTPALVDSEPIHATPPVDDDAVPGSTAEPIRVTAIATVPRTESVPPTVPPVQAQPAPPQPVQEQHAAPQPLQVQPLPPSPPVTPNAPATAAPAAQTPKQSTRKRRGLRGHRDKLLSNAAPPPKPPSAPTAPPPPVAIPMPTFNPLPNPFNQNATPAAAPPVVAAPAAAAPIVLRTPDPPKAPTPLRLKTDSPASFNSPPVRSERREQADVSRTLFREREEPESTGTFPWRLAGAAVAVIVAVIGVGRAYLPSHESSPQPLEATAPPSGNPAEKIEPLKAGSVAISTQPAGAHVLLDGKAVGDSPVTLQGVTPGKHTLTFVTSSGTVKKPIRVEPGKPLSLDVPIYSGWIAVFSPVALDIAENGKAIGTTEQGRLMLSPGRHQLTFSNGEMGYKTTQAVDIEPGEERSISLVPTGDLSANAVPWAEVWINGTKVGDTPVGNLHIPLGTHEITFKNPKFPDRQVTVTVTARGTATAFVDFSK